MRVLGSLAVKGRNIRSVAVVHADSKAQGSTGRLKAEVPNISAVDMEVVERSFSIQIRRVRDCVCRQSTILIALHELESPLRDSDQPFSLTDWEIARYSEEDNCG